MGSTDRRRVTTSEIALRAGVSRATVSYVLNQSPGRPVSDSTRDRILKAASELGHLPYAPAIALRGDPSRTILLLTPSYSYGEISGNYLNETSALLAAEGFVVMSVLVPDGDYANDQILELWNHVNPEVVVAAGGLIPAVARDRIRRSHVVLVDDRDAVDLFHAGRMQADYLVGRGVTRIGYAGPAASALGVYSERSLRGVRAGCQAHGLPAPSAHVISRDAESIDAGIDDWLLGDGTPVGVCAHNDEIALRIVARMRMRGLTPGEDILVIGSDDIASAQLELTTIHVDWRMVARDLAAAVVAAVRGDTAEDTSRFPSEYTRLVVRTSA